MWPFSDPYPQISVDKLGVQYDYIFLGGGNTGCVLARRLGESGTHTILLVERGDAGDSWLNRTPLTSLHHWSDGKHSNVFDSAPDSVLGRSFSLITGFSLGGSTRINGGPLEVRSFERYECNSSEQAGNAANHLSFLPILDMHSPLEPSLGWNKMQFTVDADEIRQSAFRAYLPRLWVNSMAKHLHICTRAIAAKPVFSRAPNGQLHADSIEIHSMDGQRAERSFWLAARSRVPNCSCSGWWSTLLNSSPNSLSPYSGVGPTDHLSEMGIDVVDYLPGVGAHLVHQRHIGKHRIFNSFYVRAARSSLCPTSYNCPLSDLMWALFRRPWTLVGQLYKYLRRGTGWLMCTTVEVEIFGKSSLVRADAALDALSDRDKDPFAPGNIPDFACGIADPRGPGIDRSKGFFGLNWALLKVDSRGQVYLRSRDPTDTPLCQMRYLTAAVDRAALRAALRVSVKLAHQMRTDGYALTGVKVPHALDDAALDEFISGGVETMYH
ncbi:hypothetical protein B0H17DRAFT_1202243 [Mycena rosella]|uniref:Glucose-methanol-choline oxidoreductase C-terminal domain-containing protein n=1 Tax=Mycena rosella TaxID=1033263 RepID=A0AAD7DGB3_MYCRO|nr:hypothetical protein B0H17DRAFT_1202243 [Mycena rosella]